jgi:hypothetical protein
MKSLPQEMQPAKSHTISAAVRLQYTSNQDMHFPLQLSVSTPRSLLQILWIHLREEVSIRFQRKVHKNKG